MSTVKLPLSAGMRAVTLKVIVTKERRTRLRISIGLRLLKLAIRVMGCKIDLSFVPPAAD